MENQPKKLFWQVPLFLLLLIGMGNLIMLIFLRPINFSWTVFAFASANSVFIGGAFMLVLTGLVKLLDRKLPWLQAPLKRLLVQFFLTVALSLLIIVLAILFNGFFSGQTITSAYFLENGVFMLKVAFTFIFLGSLISNAVLFFRNWKEAAVQQEILKREQLVLRYETLKSQVNPHFLFNNLNSLSSLIHSSPDKAIEFVKELSEVYRYVLDQKDHELVDLASELKFLESYVFLNKIRFDSNLDVQIEVQPGKFKVIPLSVQMLVENAVKHNEISAKNPLWIKVYSDDGEYLTVENKLQKKNASEGNGSGLQNIKSRYRFFTDKDITIGISVDRFKVRIPLLID